MTNVPRTAAAVFALLAASLATARASAAPTVWAIDDGEKVRRDDTTSPFEHGEGNPVWQPGGPVRLFAMRNESVAFQVVVEAGDDELEQVQVDLETLDGPGPAQLASPEREVWKRGQPMGRPIERFVEHFLSIERPSASGVDARSASAGWEQGSGPPPGEWTGPVPDALIPVTQAPPWDPYPMHVGRGSNGIVWIDLNVPRDQEPGTYRGAVVVRAGDATLATLPVELEIAPEILPDRTVTAVAGYDASILAARSGGRAEGPLWQLLRSHRIVPLHDVENEQDFQRQRSALDGSMYTRERGYVGPAPGLGDGEIALGVRGAFGAPDKATIAFAMGLAKSIANERLFGGSDVFVWAADETCSSPWGHEWVNALRESDEPVAHRLRVGWSCSVQGPSTQPVDLPMAKATWDPMDARRALADGKTPWVYGGVLPRTGTFLLDAPATSPRVNGWLQAMLGIPRWLVPDVARWSRDDETPLDPFAEPETVRDASNGWQNGGDLLVYPGSQRDAFPEHSANVDAVFPSIRLKNWRRGLEDAGYLQLARERDRIAADAVAAWLVPTAMGDARSGAPASWGDRGFPFHQARAALLAIAEGREPAALSERSERPTPVATPALAAGWGGGQAGAVAALLLASGATFLRRRRAT